MTTLVVLVLLAVVALPARAGADALSTTLDGVAKRILDVKDLKGKKVGVESFAMGGGQFTELGGHLAGRLDVALTGFAAPSGVEMVTRQHLCDVIRENKLWVDDRFDPSLHKKLGRLGQADFMVAGRVVAAGGQASVSVRVLDTETGRQVWADAVTLPLDRMLGELAARAVVGDGCGTPTQTAAAAPEPTEAQRERLDVKIWTDKPSYRIGDTIRFGLRVNRDAYVTLVNIGTSGDVTIIFPNRFHPTFFVRGGVDVIIPPADAGFTLTVKPPGGFDQVRAIATSEPVQFQAGDFGSTSVFRSLDQTQTRNLAVEIKSERERMTPGKWAEATIAVEVRP